MLLTDSHSCWLWPFTCHCDVYVWCFILQMSLENWLAIKLCIIHKITGCFHCGRKSESAHFQINQHIKKSLQFIPILALCSWLGYHVSHSLNCKTSLFFFRHQCFDKGQFSQHLYLKRNQRRGYLYGKMRKHKVKYITSTLLLIDRPSATTV